MTRNIARRCATLAALLAWSPAARAARIACVGDSITFGYGLGNPNAESYPAVLAASLGAEHIVQNFGVSGATLLKNGDHPYWAEAKFTASHDFAPDVVVVMLGTNDAKPQNWSHKSDFSADYLEFIASYQALGALVYIATPPPVFPPGAFDIPPAVVANEVVPLVRAIAGDAQLPLVEVFTALSGSPDAFPDTVHPNATGAALVAGAVLSALMRSGFAAPGAVASSASTVDSGVPSASASAAASSSSSPGEPVGSSTASSPSSSIAMGAGSAPGSTSGPSASAGGPGGPGVGDPPTAATASSAAPAAASAAASVPVMASGSSLPAAVSAASALAAAPSVAASSSGAALPNADDLRSCDCRLSPVSATTRVYHLLGALLFLAASILRLRSRA